MPDRIVQHPALLRPVRLKQRLIAEQLLEDRTGGLVWDSAALLVEWLATTPEAQRYVADATVLELGAGVGLLSIAAALLGATRVTLTDGDPAVCAAAQANVDLNGVADTVRVARLIWGDDDHLSRVVALPSGEGEGEPCAQTVLASDVLYDGDHKEPLERTMRALIRHGGCRHVLFAWRDRGFEEEAFLARLSDLGTVRTVWTARDADGGSDDDADAGADGNVPRACGRTPTRRNAGINVLNVHPSPLSKPRVTG